MYALHIIIMRQTSMYEPFCNKNIMYSLNMYVRKSCIDSSHCGPLWIWWAKKDPIWSPIQLPKNVIQVYSDGFDPVTKSDPDSLQYSRILNSPLQYAITELKKLSNMIYSPVSFYNNAIQLPKDVIQVYTDGFNLVTKSDGDSLQYSRILNSLLQYAITEVLFKV